MRCEGKTTTPVAGCEDEGAGTASRRSTDEANLLPDTIELRASGDIGMMIAAMLLDMAKNQRDTARQMKDASLKAEESAQAAKLEAMEAAADAKFTAGMISGSTTIMSGASSIGGGIKGTEPAMESWRGTGKAVEGGGKVGETIANGIAADRAQDEARADFAAKQAGRGVEAAKDNDKDARDTARKAIDLLKEWQGAKDSASKAALFRA